MQLGRMEDLEMRRKQHCQVHQRLEKASTLVPTLLLEQNRCPQALQRMHWKSQAEEGTRKMGLCKGKWYLFSLWRSHVATSQVTQSAVGPRHLTRVSFLLRG